jgi:hypothetical protein
MRFWFWVWSSALEGVFRLMLHSEEGRRDRRGDVSLFLKFCQTVLVAPPVCLSRIL